jgi:hypothetical protein
MTETDLDRGGVRQCAQGAGARRTDALNQGWMLIAAQSLVSVGRDVKDRIASDVACRLAQSLRK